MVLDFIGFDVGKLVDRELIVYESILLILYLGFLVLDFRLEFVRMFRG